MPRETKSKSKKRKASEKEHDSGSKKAKAIRCADCIDFKEEKELNAELRKEVAKLHDNLGEVEEENALLHQEKETLGRELQAARDAEAKLHEGYSQQLADATVKHTEEIKKLKEELEVARRTIHQQQTVVTRTFAASSRVAIECERMRDQYTRMLSERVNEHAAQADSFVADP